MSVNLARCPTDWRYHYNADGTRGSEEFWNATWYVEPDPAHWHNGHQSIRSERSPDCPIDQVWCDPQTPEHTELCKSREILVPNENGGWLMPLIKPSDHIVFKAWLKTSPSSIGCTHIYGGIRLGIDFTGPTATTPQDGEVGYNGTTGTHGVENWDGSGMTVEEMASVYAQWNSDWKFVVMDFVLPDKFHNTQNSKIPYGTLFTPQKILPWVQVWCAEHGNLDAGKAWFADTEFYINPPPDLTIPLVVLAGAAIGLGVSRVI